MRSKVIISYLSGWWIVDIICSFPYSIVFESIFQDQSGGTLSDISKTPKLLRILKIIRFLRIFRIVKVLKLKRFLYKIEEYIVTETLSLILEILKILMIIFFMVHIFACMFFYVGDFYSSSEPMTWINKSGIQDMSPYDQYITAAYYSFTTMATVGYGDITPVIIPERVYGICAMLIAWGFFAYIVGAITSILSKSNMIIAELKLK